MRGFKMNKEWINWFFDFECGGNLFDVFEVVLSKF